MVSAKNETRGVRLGRAEAGFTLVELVVVLVILAAVAGIVVPAVAMIGRSTDMASSASNQHQLSSNIQQYFVLQKRYPIGMDSLLQAGTGATGTPNGVYAPKDSTGATGSSANTSLQVSGLPKSGPDLWQILQMVTLSSSTNDSGLGGDSGKTLLRSFTRGGFDFVYDHQEYDPVAVVGEPNANESGKIRRNLSSSGAVQLAVIQGSSGQAADSATMPGTGAPPTGGTLTNIIRKIVPTDIDANGNYVPEPGTILVALGVGPRSHLVPTTMVNAPIYPGCDGTYYGRYVAIFKVFKNGERPILVAVVDAYGRSPDYTQQQFNESLPNRARQG